MIYITWNERSPSGAGADGPKRRALYSLKNDRLQDAHEFARVETEASGRGITYRVEVTEATEDELWLQDIDIWTNGRDEFGPNVPLSDKEIKMAANLRDSMEPYNIGAVLGDARVRARQQRDRVLEFMRLEVMEFVDPRTNEVNTTLLAEEAAYESGVFSFQQANDLLDDETHWIWDLAIKVADEINDAEIARYQDEQAQAYAEIQSQDYEEYGDWYNR